MIMWCSGGKHRHHHIDGSFALSIIINSGGRYLGHKAASLSRSPLARPFAALARAITLTVVVVVLDGHCSVQLRSQQY